MKKQFLYILFFFLLFCLTSAAQHKEFKQFTKKEGLPSNVVYNMIQDSKGYLWFATELGVSRYDGSRFQNFDVQSGLPDATVFQISEDEIGRIWFIPISNKLSYFENNKIHEYKYNDSLQKHLKKSSIYTNFSFKADKENNISIGMYGSGRFTISSDGKITNRFLENHVKEGYILKNKNEALFISNSKEGLKMTEYNICIEENKTSSYVRVSNLNNKVSYGLIYSIVNASGHILISINNSLYEISGNVVIRKKEFASRIICLTKDKNNNIWVGLYKFGVYCFPDGRIDQEARYHLLKSNSVCYVLKDSEDSWWFSTLDAGVFYLPSLAYTSYSVEDGLSDNTVNTVFANNNGIWLGMNNNTINSIKNSSVKHLIIADNKSIVVNSMQYDSYRDRLWIGTNLFGYYLNFRNTQMDRISFFQDSLKFGLNDIYSGKSGEVWLASMNGFYKINKADKKTFYPKGKDFVWRITSCAPISDSVFYVGGINGLWKFSDGNFIFLGKENKLFSNRINVIRKCNFNNSFLMGTKGAGLVIILNNKEVKQLSLKNGLAGNVINSIYIYNNEIFIATDKGLSILTLKSHDKFDYSIETISTDDGLISNEINYVYKNENVVYVATNLGLTYFELSEIHKVLKPPPIHISKIEIMNRDTLVENNFVLNYDQNLIAFNVIGIGFSSSEKIRYKYKLEGAGNDWIFTSNPQIQFPFLLPGNYKFVVYAQNKDGVWSEKPAEKLFVIRPPFWKTWWFVSLAVLLFVTGIVIAYTLRIHTLKKRNQLKLQLNKYMQQALIKQMNPHFIFNSLNSIQHFILQNDRMSSNKYLTKFSRLMRVTLENSQHQSIPLQDEIDALTLYMELESLRFKEKFDFEIIVDPEINPLECKVPTLLIQPYIENSIWHGLMYKDDKGKLKLNLKLSDDILVCSIEDNGIGRAKAMEIKSKSGKSHKSIGSNITEERLNLLNSLNNISMSVKYTDLYDSKGISLGTKVEIFIPVTY